MSEVLRLSSAAWSLLHVLVLFLFFYSSRLERKKTLVITLSTWVPLIALNLLMLYFLGQDLYGKLMLLTLVVPSFLFFFLLAKHRDCRFLFTFCLAVPLMFAALSTAVMAFFWRSVSAEIIGGPDAGVFLCLGVYSFCLVVFRFLSLCYRMEQNAVLYTIQGVLHTPVTT